MAHSSPEPSAACSERGRVRRAGRRAPHAGRAVMAHSSPEPAAGWFGEGNPVRGWGDFWRYTRGIALRHHGLFTGRPYGTACGEGGAGFR